MNPQSSGNEIKNKPYYDSPSEVEHCVGADAPAMQYDPAGHRVDDVEAEMDPPGQNRPAGHDTQAPVKA